MLEKLVYGPKHKWVLLAIAIVTLLCGYYVRDLKFEYRSENFFPVNDPELQAFQDFRKKFENDTDFILVGIEHEPSVFDKEFLTKIDSVTGQLIDLPWIQYAVSPTNLKYPVIGTFGPLEIPVLHFDDPERYHEDSIKIYGNDEWVESVFSADGSAVLLYLKHLPNLEATSADSMLLQVEQIIKGQNFQQIHLGGLLVGEKVYINKMQQDLLVFFSMSVVLVILFLYGVYRTPLAIIVPILVVVLAIIWLMGIMGIVGKRLEILVILLPSILFVIGMSDIVHILTKFIEEIRRSADKKKALRFTIKEIGYATFLTSLTTAVGFISLYSANSRPIKEFGIYAAIGVFIAYLLAFTLMPATLLRLKDPVNSLRVFRPSRWSGKMHQLFAAVLKYKMHILLCSVLAILWSFWGISKIKGNYYLLDELPKENSLKKDSHFFNQHFGGIRSFEMMVGVKGYDKTVYSPEFLKEMAKIDQFLKNDLEMKGVTSIVNSVKTLNRAVNGGLQAYFTIPEDASGYRKLSKYMKLVQARDSQYKMVADSIRWARISAKLGDIGSLRALEQENRIKNFIRQEIDTSLVRYRITSSALLIDRNNERVPVSIFKGLAVALLVIALLAGLIFRSWWLVGITLITNIFPLILIAAIMGIFGISLRLSTSIIFTIVFGIAVDDTIHFISKFKVELNKGKSLLYALKRTYISTGKAIVVTSVIIAGGFATLLLSSFQSSFYTGLLVGLALLFAVLIDLSLLPVLLMLFYRVKSKTSVELIAKKA